MAFVSAATSTSFVRAPTRHALCLRRPIVSHMRRRSRWTPCASIEKEVSEEIKTAMRSKDADALKALRSIRAAFIIALKAEGAADTLSDAEAIACLRKLAKQRVESIEMFRSGGRDDLADGEAAELTIIERWLPKLASEDTVAEWVKTAIEKTGASKPGDMGKVMGVVMKEHRQEVDGNMVRKLASEMLS